VPRNKLGSAHPLDSKWQITPTYSIGCPIGSYGVPHQAVVRAGVNGNGRQLGALMLAPVIRRPLDLAHWNDGPSY
jgi:hypothetical protein